MNENNTVYSISDVSECGIVANLDHPFLHTSADRLCWLHVRPSDSVGPSEKLFVPIEMKTATQDNTATAAFNRIRDFPPGSRFVHVSFVSEDFKSLVWNPSYRCQVLHHAVVFKTHHVLFVCADPSSIIYVLLVHVPENMISMYVQATTSYFFIQLAP